MLTLPSSYQSAITWSAQLFAFAMAGLLAHRRHHHECDEQETEAQGAMKGEGSNHGAERAGVPGFPRSLASLPAAIEPVVSAG